MPAPSSSPTDPAVGHLAGLAEGADGPLGVLAMLARRLDRSIEAVRKLWFRAIQQLQQELGASS